MILITGAAGFVGRHLVHKLTTAGHRVRVLLPRSSYHRLPFDPDNDCIEVFDGSIFQPEDVHRAMNGVHTVFHLASAQWWGSARDLEYVDLGGTRNVMMSARSARIGRVILLSQIGADPASGYALLRVKGAVEEAVRKSGIPYTIFRCNVLFGERDRFVNNLAMMLHSNWFTVLQPGAGEAILHPLHIDDLTQALLNALENVDLLDATVEIGGAEYMTYHELLRTVMRVTGTHRQIIALPPYMLRGLNRIVRTFFRRYPVTPQWYDIVASNRTADLSNLYNYTGVSARRFEDTLLSYMPQRHYGRELLRYLFRRPPRPRF